MGSLLATAVIGMAIVADLGLAQSTESSTTIAGASFGGFMSKPPAGSPPAWGMGIGFERNVTSRTGGRVYLHVMKAMPFGDDARVCPPTPPKCELPRYPDVIASGELQVLVAPGSNAVIRFLLASGATAAFGSRESVRGASSLDNRIRVRGTLRGGLELAFGENRRGPTLQLSRALYSSPLLSMRRLDALTLLFGF